VVTLWFHQFSANISSDLVSAVQPDPVRGSIVRCRSRTSKFRYVVGHVTVDDVARWVTSTATIRPRSSVAAATRSLWTSSSSAGTGCLRPHASRRTTAPDCVRSFIIRYCLLAFANCCRPRSESSIRPLRTTLKTYYFFQVVQLLGLQGRNSDRSTRTWPEVFCEAKNPQNSFST